MRRAIREFSLAAQIFDSFLAAVDNVEWVVNFRFGEGFPGQKNVVALFDQ